MATLTTPPAVGTAPDASAGAVSTMPSRATGPLIVATDGSESADAAFTAARLLAHRSGADVEVVGVVEAVIPYVPTGYPFVVPLETGAVELEQLRTRARHQLSALVGDAPGWSVETLYGAPAATLRRIARERNAELLITGVSRHGVVDRVFGEETAPHIAQITETPMLAVAPSMARLPRTVVIAIDLDSPSVPDSPAIRALLSEATTVYFVNSKPRTDVLPEASVETWERTYMESLEEASSRVKDSVDLPPKVFRQLVTLTGNPAREILSFASYAKAELIIVGQRRRWMLHRRMGGGMPTQILRATTCSVLVLPRGRARAATRPATAAAPRSSRTETITERARWAPRLAQFTRLNTGRRVMMEVDDVELGVQAQATEYPFVGMDYDHYDDRVEIMLGERIGRTAHLTHSVGKPVSVDILDDADGRALAIRVANDRGQALLTFLP
jgi:nucleotide-binding universal stress UspA family protein